MILVQLRGRPPTEQMTFQLFTIETHILSLALNSNVRQARFSASLPYESTYNSDLILLHHTLRDTLVSKPSVFGGAAVRNRSKT